MAGPGAGDQPGGLDPVELAHVDVHQHQVGRQLGAGGDRRLAGVDLGDQLEALDAGQHGTGRLPEGRLVVDDHHAHALGHGVLLRSHDHPRAQVVSVASVPLPVSGCG